MAKNAFAAKLQKAEKLWAKAKQRTPDFGADLPDGQYHARLVKAELGESQKGRLQVSWRAVVLTGENKGENINWWTGLETEDNIFYFHRDLARLGKEVPEEPKAVEAVLMDLESEKPALRLTLKTNGEYQNVRIGKLLSSEEMGDVEEPETEEAETEPEPEVEEQEEPEAEPEVEEEPEEVEEPEEPEAEEELGVEVGMRVAFELSGKETVGTISSIDEDANRVVVKTDAGKKFKLDPEKLRPAPKVKVSKK